MLVFLALIFCEDCSCDVASFNFYVYVFNYLFISLLVYVIVLQLIFYLEVKLRSVISVSNYFSHDSGITVAYSAPTRHGCLKVVENNYCASKRGMSYVSFFDLISYWCWSFWSLQVLL